MAVSLHFSRGQFYSGFVDKVGRVLEMNVKHLFNHMGFPIYRVHVTTASAECLSASVDTG